MNQTINHTATPTASPVGSIILDCCEIPVFQYAGKLYLGHVAEALRDFRKQAVTLDFATWCSSNLQVLKAA